MSPIHTVALLGADGKLGPAILHALLAHNFKVTILKRASSKSQDDYPPSTTVTRVPDAFDIPSLTQILAGHDAVIATIKGSQVDIQARLATASVQAGVQRFIPADFGSADSASPWAQSLVPLFKRKTELRERLVELSRGNEGFSWTSLVCGHFFDWSPEFLHIWPRERRADVLGDGQAKCSASTLERIGEATARILLKAEETRDRVVYVQSFCASQKEVLAAFERATKSDSGPGSGTGTEEGWRINRLDAKVYEREEKLKADGGDLEAVENLVWLLGTLDADWRTREGFLMEVLGLEDEDMDEAVRKVVRENQ